MSTLFLTSNFSSVSTTIDTFLDANLKKSKALFIYTAAEVEKGDKTWLNDDREALQKMGFEVIDYSITGKTVDDFQKDFEEVRVVVVSGGNVFYLLEKAQESGFISFIQDFAERPGNVYIGSSAGAVITGPDIQPFSILDDPSAAKNIQTTKGFCFTDLYLFVHWGSENFKTSYLQGMPRLYQEMGKTVLLTNHQFLYVNNGVYSIQEAQR